MDASIILQGQAPDILGAMDRGRAAAENQINLNRQNALAQLYKTQGAGILAGDQGALNALAGVDPSAAMAAQGNLLGMESTRLGMDQTRQQMAVLDENNKRAAEEYARGLSKEQAAAEAAKIEAGVKQALMAPTPEAFDALMVQIGQPDMVGQFENRDMLAGQFMSVAEILKMTNPEGPEWRAATPEEAAANGAVAGQINTKTGKFDAQNPPSGFAVTTSPDGTTTIEQGPGVTNGRTGKPTEGSLASEGYLQRMKGAEEIFAQLETQGTTALGWTDRPAVDTDFETMKLTEPEQLLLQAQRDWVRAKLRKESGAVIGPDEMAAEIKQYFPQPGEGPKVVAQKKEARKRAEEQLRITAMLPAGDPNSPPPAFDQAEIDALMNGP